MKKTDLDIINEIESLVKSECANPIDYDGYIENCIMNEAESAAHWFGRNLKQFTCLVNRARIRLIYPQTTRGQK